jgi:peptidyl-prolyl cis-trans isomerase A (cyclophilin A)
MRTFYIFLFSILLFSCKNQTHINPQIEIKTELGTIIVELFPEKAPVTCENFLKYVDEKLLSEASFYRTVTMANQPNNDIKIEVIQGGLGFDVEESAYPPIQLETTKTTGLKHLDGTISMARAEPGTASSEFFICIGNQPELDYGGMRNNDGQGFAAFGQVIKGMNIVQKIQELPNHEQFFINPISITISRTE